MSIGVLELRDLIAEFCDGYAAAIGVQPTSDWLVLKTMEEAGELVQAFLRQSKRARDRGEDEAQLKRAMDDEIADLVGFSLVLAKRFDIDLLRSLERKWHLPDGSLE